MSGTARTLGFRVGSIAAAASVASSLVSCGDSADEAQQDDDTTTAVQPDQAETAAFNKLVDDESITTSEFVGAIEGTEIYAAFVISTQNNSGDISNARAYFCDGDRVADWFALQSNDGDQLTFASRSGKTFTATYSGATVTADLELGGAQRNVQAPQVDADGEAGLYLADSTIDADLLDDERGGWIVLEDGTQRGAIRATTTILPGGSLNLASTQVVVAGREVMLRAITHIIWIGSH